MKSVDNLKFYEKALICKDLNENFKCLNSNFYTAFMLFAFTIFFSTLSLLRIVTYSLIDEKLDFAFIPSALLIMFSAIFSTEIIVKIQQIKHMSEQVTGIKQRTDVLGVIFDLFKGKKVFCKELLDPEFVNSNEKLNKLFDFFTVENKKLSDSVEKNIINFKQQLLDSNSLHELIALIDTLPENKKVKLLEKHIIEDENGVHINYGGALQIIEEMDLLLKKEEREKISKLIINNSREQQ